MVPVGMTDYLVAVSEDQIEVARPYLNDATIIVRPSDLSADDAKSRMANIAMLGVLNRYLKFPADLWETLIRENFAGPVGEANVLAFRRGANLI